MRSELSPNLGHPNRYRGFDIIGCFIARYRPVYINQPLLLNHKLERELPYIEAKNPLIRFGRGPAAITLTISLGPAWVVPLVLLFYQVNFMMMANHAISLHTSCRRLVFK